jgi:PST family polysaccharide transporter
VQKEALSDADVNSGFALSLIAGVVFTAALLLAAPYLAAYFREPSMTAIIEVLSLVFIIDSLIVVPEALLQRNLDFKKLAIIDNIAYLVGIGGIGVPLAYLGYGAWALIFSQIALRLIRAALFFGLINHTCHLAWCAQSVKRLLITGGGFALGRVFGFIALYADNIIVGRQLGTIAVGNYSRAYQLMTLPSTLIAQMADRVLFPALSKCQNDKERLNSALLTFIEVLATISMPLSIAALIASDEAVRVFLGPGWEEVGRILTVLSYGIFFRTADKAGDTVARAAGRAYLHAWVHCLYAVAVTLGAYIGSFYGLLGVSWGVLGAVAINYLAMSYLALSAVEGSWKAFLAAHYPGLLLSSVFGFISLLIVPIIQTHVSAVGILVVVGALLFFSTFVSWFLLPISTKARFMGLYRKLRR